MLKSIVCTYPDFRMLPKGLKQMLVASENLFFNEVSGPAQFNTGRDGENNRQVWPAAAKGFDSNRLAIQA